MARSGRESAQLGASHRWGLSLSLSLGPKRLAKESNNIDLSAEKDDDYQPSDEANGKIHGSDPRRRRICTQLSFRR